MQVLADVFFIYIIFKKISCMLVNGMIFLKIANNFIRAVLLKIWTAQHLGFCETVGFKLLLIATPEIFCPRSPSSASS